MRRRALGILAGFFVLVNVGRGQESIMLSEKSADLIIIPAAEAANFGCSLSCGDLNGDGFEDLLVGAPAYNKVGEPLRGSVYIIFGKPLLPDTLDLEKSFEGVSVIVAPDSVDLGWSVECGDVNVDGVDDVLVGAPWCSPLGRREAGAVYVIYGKATGLPDLWELDTSPADELIVGSEAGDALGVSLALGDLDNNGIQDLALGAFKARRPDSTRYLTGGVFLLLNTDNPPPLEDLALPRRFVVQIAGERPNDYCGWSVCCGDVNGDAISDVIVGAHKANAHPPLPDQGKAYLILGRHIFPGLINIEMDGADIQFNGAQFQEHLAYSLAVGDFNGDNFGDMVFGCRQASPDEVSRSGRVRVVFGNSAMPKLVDFETCLADLDIFGEAAGSMLGKAMAVGDVNRDGFDDLLVGAPFSEFNVPTPAGRAYLFLGGAGFSGVWDLKSRPADLSVVGADSSDHLGTSLTCGDLNGDGYDDMIVAALGRKPNGAVYVIFGRETTSVNDFQKRAQPPQQFRLYQNYPNPFNAETTIIYRIPQHSHIALSVYNLLGEQVRRLVNENKPAGTYSIRWDGRDTYGKQVAGGIYLYKIEAVGSSGRFVQTRKMILMR